MGSQGWFGFFFSTSLAWDRFVTHSHTLVWIWGGQRSYRNKGLLDSFIHLDHIFTSGVLENRLGANLERGVIVVGNSR